jgi:type IV pilus assembly protein PilM
LFQFDALWRREPASLLGVDLRASSIRLIELGQRRAGDWVLERWGQEPLEPGWVNDGHLEDFEPVAQSLRRLVKKCGTRTREVAMALPPSAVITRKTRLPVGLSDAEMELQVEIEAHHYLPFPLEEVSLDFCVVGPDAPDLQDVEVLIAASRREKVQDRLGLAEAAGLKLLVVDIETFAARRAAGRLIDRLPRLGPEALVALFEIGSQATRLQVLRSGEALYDRDQLFGGNQLTQQIGRRYGYSPQEAEQRKRSGDLPADFAGTVLAPFVDSLGQEVAQALQFFFASTPHDQVDHVLLAGGSAHLPGLTDTVTRLTGFPSTMADPFEGMGLGAGLRHPQLRQEAPGFLTACGLAMRRFTR